MTIFVEVLKRNYITNKITLAKIDSLLNDEKITQEEYDFIRELDFEEE